MSRSASIALLLLGLILFMGSCAPLGFVIYHEAIITPTESFPLTGPGGSDMAMFSAVPGSLARFAIEADISTDSVQEDPDSLDDNYLARFRFPISYTIRDTRGNSLVSEDVVLAWQDGGSISKSNEETTSTGGTLKATTHLDKFTVPEDGTVEVVIGFSPDTTYEARVTSPQLQFYEGMVDNTWYVTAAVIMLFAGFIMAITGFIFAVSGAVSSNYQQSPAGQHSAAAGEIVRSKDITQQAMFIHLSALAGYVIPFGNIILPVVLWLVWRDKDPYLDDTGREAVNFQLSMLVYYLVCIILFFVLIGMVLIIAVTIFHLTYIIIASVQVSRGADFRYPLTIRFIKA